MSIAKLVVPAALLVTGVTIVAGTSVAQTTSATPTVLEKVTVTAQPDEVAHEVDRDVYDLRNNIQAKTGNLADVLSSLPSVNIAPNGSLSLGGGSVAVLIDGKPSPLLRDVSLADALHSLPASIFERIEIVTNPGPEFSMNGATIINLVTKKTQQAARKGEVAISAGSRGRRNGSLSGSYGSGQWAFTGNGGVRKDLRHDILDVDRIAKNADGSVANREVENRPTYVPYTNVFGSLVAGYDATNRDAFSIGAEGALRHRPRHFVDHRTVTAPDGSVTNEIVTRDEAEQHFNHYSGTGAYRRKDLFGRDSLKVEWKHEDYDTKRDSSDVESFITPPLVDNVYRQLRLERELIDTFSGDYVLSLANESELKGGLEVEADRDRSSMTLESAVPETNAEDRFHLNRTLFVTYASYRTTRGKWTTKGGLRGEIMVTRFSQDAAPSTTLRDRQWSPTLSISRELNSRTALSFNYSRRIDRPAPNQLNPLRTVVISVTGMGNPYLEPGETQSLDIGYRYAKKPFNLSSALYVRLLNNQIVGYSYALNPGDTTLVSSYENAGNGTAVGIDTSVQWRALAKCDLTLSADVQHVRQAAPVGGVEITSATYTYLAKLDVAWKPDPDDSFQMQGQLRGRSLSAGGTQSGYGLLNLSYSHTFTPQAKLILNANDVLNSVSYRESVDNSQYRQMSELAVPGRVFYLGLTYEIGPASVEK